MSSPGWGACRGRRETHARIGGGRRVGEQVPRGFWAAAREEPDRVALVDAAGRAWTAGELLSGANRLVHALRARGVQPFDPVATLTRNSAELFQVLLAVFQGGWQYVPLNTHLTAAELAYILGDSGAAALFADADLAAVATAAAEEGGVPAGARIAIGGAIPGFTSPRRRARRPARHHPRRPRRGPVHAVHVGDDGTTEGGATRPAEVRSRDRGWPRTAPTSPATTSSPVATPSTWSRRRCTTSRR